MISSPGTLTSQLFNQYAYVQNKPLVYTDPSGLLYCEVFCIAVGLGATIVCTVAGGGYPCALIGAAGGVLCYQLACVDEVLPNPPPTSSPSPPGACYSGRKGC
jgi:hypothetical protein